MEKKTEETTPQNPVVEETPEVEEPTTPTEPEPKEDSISAEELEELKKNAGVSSQNYERAKKAEKEAKELREKLQAQEVLPEVDEDEDLKSEVSKLKATVAKSEVIEQYPEMKEVWSEFEEFHKQPENQGLPMVTAAKVFRVDKGLSKPTRKGLERQTGGDRIPIKNNTMSPEQAAELRTTDYRSYVDKLKKGQIKIK